ncbi:MAG TPA: NAD-dependent epimerase/dehydratase family protein, partial [Candidatus Kapabacteria bacterium]|nr:NAD-dependent epimerase/dehydratase family protein [Candidatus Kapabacteria bacterium]
MKALVTGTTGFIGSHLAEQLLSKGYDVRCLVRKTANLRWLENKPFELVYGGLSDMASLVAAVKDVDCIYHVAGLTAAKSREEFLRGNRDATRNLLEAAGENGNALKRFIYVSSQAAVGPSPTAKPIDETFPYHPITAYGESKKAAEEEVQKFSSVFPITIVRPPAVYGP